MAYFSPKKALKRNVVSETVSGNQVYNMIQEHLDHFREYHDVEPAVVLKVWMHEDDLPSLSTTDDEPVPNYSLQGTINAKYLMGTQNLPPHIRPLSHHVVTYPLPGEIVNVRRIGSYYYYDNLPLNIYDRIDQNLSRGLLYAFGPMGKYEDKKSPRAQLIKWNKKLYAEPGDTFIQGRYGNHVKLGSDSIYTSPTLKLINGQAQTPESIFMDMTGESWPHLEDINNDGSSIYMLSGRDESTFLPSYKDSANLPKALFGNQIIVNSDRLIFNAKGNPSNTETPPAGSIHMFATDQINLSSNSGLYVETGDKGIVALGTDADALKNPVVKGKELLLALNKILTVIKEFSHTLGHSSGAVETNTSGVKLDSINTAGHTLRDAIIKIEKDFLTASTTEDGESKPPKIFSQRTFTI